MVMRYPSFKWNWSFSCKFAILEKFVNTDDHAIVGSLWK